MKLIIVCIIIFICLWCCISAEDVMEENKISISPHRRCDYLLDQLKYYRQYVSEREVAYSVDGYSQTGRYYQIVMHNRDLLRDLTARYESSCLVD